ncbi:MAG: short-chain dehydrogenase, partial [Bradyrhizobiaceae bacterium]|nr:short-chain dehydrogenase [Bradyrhizobiaceae bacterium]
MTTPVTRPKRKNPVLRTRLPTLPPQVRSRVALGLTAGAARGVFELQVCEDCGSVQYPPREACRACLSVRLVWRPQDGAGELIAETRLHHSQELYFRERLPWRIGLVRLDAGPSTVVHVHNNVARAPVRVRVTSGLDRSNQAALIALPEHTMPHMADDPELREMTCDPKF